MQPLDVAFIAALAQGTAVALVVALALCAALMVKSIVDFTRTGPEMAEEVVTHYRLYLVMSLGRLLLFAFLVIAFLALPGVVAYAVSMPALGTGFRPVVAAAAATVSVLVLTARRFVHTLLISPGVIAASSLYSMTHFHALWRSLTRRRLLALDMVLLVAASAWLFAGLAAMADAGAWLSALLLTGLALLYTVTCWAATRVREPKPVATGRASERCPNILLIGSDTLRADRLSGAGYPRELTPNLARLAKRGTQFTDCYVPCARTAPSLVSLLTGTWPHTHGVRDTFVTPEQTRLDVPALPQILKGAGYRAAIVGDWAASDADRFDFGFDDRDLPHDQWNIKFLLRQGPKDLRLFLSLFAQNEFGKTLLPEIYYLGGIPLTEEVGRETRRMIEHLARQEQPFFLMSFMATTHPPFTSKHPYYSLFSNPDYDGESKFIMAKLRDPWEIIRAQAEPRTRFDLDQVIDLYDSCVRNFDDEVARILDYLKACDLADNTIVVVFSDHGFEFFEHETWGQGNSAIGDFSARVPIIIADPRIREPQRVGNVVRTVDIAPTLLELAGMSIPDSIEGVSLAPLLRGAPLGRDLPAFYETGVWLTHLPGTPEKHLHYPDLPELLEVPDKRSGMISLKPQYFDIVIAAKDRMVRRGKWKLTYQPLTDGVIYRLFDIEADPGCQHDVISRHPQIAAELRMLLEEWMNEDPKLVRVPQPRSVTATPEASPSGAVGAAIGRPS